MANKSKRLCNYPGCNTLVGNGYCDRHRIDKEDKRQYDKHRGSASKRGYNSRWQKARATFLKRNPICVECKKDNQIEPAVVVDHIKPHKGDMVLFWDKNNWQPLCKRHHDIKTASEDGGFGNRMG